jgi:hypothetical protein
MKMKALLVVMVCVMGLAVFSVGNAEAVPAGWYQVTITQTGVYGAVYYLALTDTAVPPAFTNYSFTVNLSDGTQKEMLATALTCFSIGGNAWAYANGGTVFSLFTR